MTMQAQAKAGQDLNNSLLFCLRSPTWTVCGRELLSGDEYVIGCINWINNNNTGSGDINWIEDDAIDSIEESRNAHRYGNPYSLWKYHSDLCGSGHYDLDVVR
jgi:hypothetical protein